jgi:hypothetical protein
MAMTKKSQFIASALVFQEPGLQIIRLAGSPTEMGLAHGRLLAGQLHCLRREFLRYLGRLTLGLGAVPLYLLVCCLAWRFRPYIPAALWEELRAVAQGAGVHLSFILFINVMDDLLNNIPHCSTFAAPLRESEAATFILGRTLDYPLFAQILCRYNTVQLLFPRDGQPLATVGWPGYCGVCAGMNRAGVALGQLSASTSDVSMAGMPAAIRNRLALQHHQTVSEVAAAIVTRPGTLGANLILASSREALLLEVSARHHQVRLPQAGILTATNHYQSPQMQPWSGTAFRRPPLSPLEDYFFSLSYSQARDRRLQELLCNCSLNIARAQKILADPHIVNPCDITSVVFNPAAGELYVAQGVELPVSQRGRFRRLSALFGPDLQVA